MCGIAGIIGARRENGQQFVKAMTFALSHRGPDSDGYFSNAIADVGVRRLSIIDVNDGRQPILNETGDLAIVFNGEIYNHRELRNELRQLGHRFKTGTDTEVILHLYEERGPRCVEYLHGMFAFAIIGRNEVFIARDRLGIKPLYLTYIQQNGILLFASEIKAFLQHPEVRISIDEQGLADRYVLYYRTGNDTIFREVKTLSPGHYMQVNATAVGLHTVVHQYYKPVIASDGDIGYAEAARGLDDVLAKAVASHLQADVPVGLTLSGGIDSSLIAHLVRSQKEVPGPAFTVSSEQKFGDLVSARAVAKALSFDHHEVIAPFSEYLDSIPLCIMADEGVCSLSALPFFILFAHVSRSVKVCLNGEGSDELFAGYPDYLHPTLKTNEVKAKLASAKRRGLPVSERARGIVMQLCGVSTFRDYLHTLLTLYQREQLEINHLEIVDHYSMAWGLEVRVPFLDDDFVSLVNSLPLSLKVNSSLSINKYVLKKYVLSRWGDLLQDPVLRVKEGLPSSCRQHQGRFDELCCAALPDEYALTHPYKNFFCQKEADGRISGKASLLIFDIFHEVFVGNRGQLPQHFSLAEFMQDRSRVRMADVVASAEV